MRDTVYGQHAEAVARLMSVATSIGHRACSARRSQRWLDGVRADYLESERLEREAYSAHVGELRAIVCRALPGVSPLDLVQIHNVLVISRGATKIGVSQTERDTYILAWWVNGQNPATTRGPDLYLLLRALWLRRPWDGLESAAAWDAMAAIEP